MKLNDERKNKVTTEAKHTFVAKSFLEDAI
jgi:hypothetical protein